MISGRKPFYKEKALIMSKGLDPHEWLVIKMKGEVLEIRSRETGETREVTWNK